MLNFNSFHLLLNKIRLVKTLLCLLDIQFCCLFKLQFVFIHFALLIKIQFVSYLVTYIHNLPVLHQSPQKQVLLTLPCFLNLLFLMLFRIHLSFECPGLVKLSGGFTDLRLLHKCFSKECVLQIILRWLRFRTKFRVLASFEHYFLPQHVLQ